MREIGLKIDSLSVRMCLLAIDVGQRRMIIPSHPHLVSDSVAKPAKKSRTITQAELSKGRLASMVKEIIADWVVDTLNEDVLSWYRWGALVTVSKDEVTQDFKVELESPNA